MLMSVAGTVTPHVTTRTSVAERCSRLTACCPQLGRRGLVGCGSNGRRYRGCDLGCWHRQGLGGQANFCLLIPETFELHLAVGRRATSVPEILKLFI
jgi:hypothetical protein